MFIYLWFIANNSDLDTFYGTKPHRRIKPQYLQHEHLFPQWKQKKQQGDFMDVIMLLVK